MFVLLFSSLLPLFLRLSSFFPLFLPFFLLLHLLVSHSPINLPLFLAFFSFPTSRTSFFSSFLTSEASSFPTFKLYYDLSLKKKKKNGCSSWARGEQEGLGWTQPCQAMHQIDIRARAQSWALRERFRSCQWASFLNFYGNVVSSRATVTAHMVGCASRSTVTKPFERFTRKFHNFLSKKKKKKKNSHWPIEKSKNRQPWRERFLRGTCDRRTQERLTKDERASLFSAEQSEWTRPGPAPDAPSLTQTLIIQSVYCANFWQGKV